VIALFLESHPVVQIAFVVGTLVVVFIAGLLVWAYLWPLNPDYQCECCGDEPRVPTVYGDDR
jgi:hypothetical protein